MKNFAIIASLAALAGCASPGPGPANYGTRAYASADPGQWRVVSVTPVPLGTGARAAAAGDTGVTTTYHPAPAAPVYAPEPVYAPHPVYVAPPVYVHPPVYVERPSYWYPPSIGLGFSFGRGWGHRHHRRGGWSGGVHFGGHRHWR